MSDIIAEKTPEVYKTLLQLTTDTLRPGALDKKTKELVAIALSVAVRCEPCLKRHLEGAKRGGATQEEVAETISVAIMMLGAPLTMSSGNR